MGDVVVKVVSKYQLDCERTQKESLPGVKFVFDESARYDWLVVYDDFPADSGAKLSFVSQKINCDPRRTILLTYEPSSIKYYGHDFVRQFAHVLTSHDKNCLLHPNSHAMPPVGVWYYGAYEDVLNLPSPPIKLHDVSVFYSGKTMSHSLHDLRHGFITGMMKRMGNDLSVFGKGYQFVAKKKEAIDTYRYHLAIENHQGSDHWTEKLSDCFLGYCMPIYAGCSNVSDYFPENSYIQIDLRCMDTAFDVIKTAISNRHYENNIRAIVEARNRVLTQYSLGHMLSDYILECERDQAKLIFLKI